MQAMETACFCNSLPKKETKSFNNKQTSKPYTLNFWYSRDKTKAYAEQITHYGEHILVIKDLKSGKLQFSITQEIEVSLKTFITRDILALPDNPEKIAPIRYQLNKFLKQKNNQNHKDDENDF